MRTLLACLALILSVIPPALADAWADKSPHKEGFVTVRGVKLNYLDWGGKGDTLLFLNGLGDTAHCFDDLAPKFTDHFHCIAFTRRGYGQSGKPTTGYDPEALMEEVRGFMDAMKIPRATLVGHSFGGFLETHFASTYPDRVDRLVYLDAIYDYSSPRWKPALKILTSVPYPRQKQADLKNLDNYRRFQQLTYFGGNPAQAFWSDALEAEMRDMVRVLRDGKIAPLTSEKDDGRFGAEAIGHCERYPIHYGKVRAPALAICSESTVWESMSPSLTPKSKSAIYTEAIRALGTMRRASWNEYREQMHHGKIVVLQHTHHYCFVQRLDEVTRLMREFLLASTQK